jgi:hypothetical protein
MLQLGDDKKTPVGYPFSRLIMSLRDPEGVVAIFIVFIETATPPAVARSDN